MHILRPYARGFIATLAIVMILSTALVALGAGRTPRTPGTPRKPRTADAWAGIDSTSWKSMVKPYVAPKPVVQKAPPAPVSQTRYEVTGSSPAIHAPAGSVKARVLAAWPGDDNWVALTVACESGFDPYQVGGGGNNYYGLFQFGPWARSAYGNPLNMSVEQQTQAAWRLIKASGSSQWSCSPYRYSP